MNTDLDSVRMSAFGHKQTFAYFHLIRIKSCDPLLITAFENPGRLRSSVIDLDSRAANICRDTVAGAGNSSVVGVIVIPGQSGP